MLPHNQFRRLQLFTSQLSYLSRKICVCLHPHRHRHNHHHHHHHYPHHHHMPSSMRPPPFYIRADIQKRHLQYCTWHQQALFYSPINDFMIWLFMKNYVHHVCINIIVVAPSPLPSPSPSPYSYVLIHSLCCSSWLVLVIPGILVDQSVGRQDCGVLGRARSLRTLLQ